MYGGGVEHGGKEKEDCIFANFLSLFCVLNNFQRGKQKIGLQLIN